MVRRGRQVGSDLGRAVRRRLGRRGGRRATMIDERDVLVGFGAAQLPGQVVDGVVVHVARRGKNVFVRRGLAPLLLAGHFHVGTSGASDPEPRAGGRRGRLLVPLRLYRWAGPSSGEVNHLVAGRRGSPALRQGRQ